MCHRIPKLSEARGERTEMVGDVVKDPTVG